MKKNLIVIMLFSIAFINHSCCKKTKPTTAVVNETRVEKNQVEEKQNYAGPHVLIYKTKGNYFNNVPVILSADKSKVVSYPDIKDVYTDGKLALPEQLSGGYLLDNRGINKDVAFTSYSYQEYSMLSKTPTASELFEKVIDKDPLIELYDCGVKYQYKSVVSELNEIINNNEFSKFKKIK